MNRGQAARRGGGKPPVSAHPAFPAIVALWFAALLGLGSLIVPVQLIERIVVATGIASLLPSAAPPLGFTARAAIALGATILGAIMGLVAARRVAASRRDSAAAGRTPEPAGRFIAAQSEFDDDEDIEDDADMDADALFLEDWEEGEAAPDAEDAGQRKRRRALAMQEEEGMSEFLSVAPLPGVGDGVEGADFDSLDDALELREVVESADVEAPLELHEPGAQVAEPDAPQFRQEFVPAAPDTGDDEGGEPESQPFAFEDKPRVGEPLAFSPPSMARQSAVEPEVPRSFEKPPAEDPIEAAFDEPEEPQENNVSEKQIFQPVAQPLAASNEPVEPATDSFPLDETSGFGEEGDGQATVGLVQLVQKLGSTLEKHREWNAGRAARAAAMPQAIPAIDAEVAEERTSPAIPQEFEAAMPDDAAEAMAAYFGRSATDDRASGSVGPVADEPIADELEPEPAPTQGQAYAPFSRDIRIGEDADAGEDEEADESADLAASFSLPLLRAPLPGSAPVIVTPTPRPSFDIPPPSAAAVAQDEGKRGDRVEVDPPARDADYGSLSSLGNPFKQNAQEFVRVDEPEQDDDAVQPAVVFPHQQVRRSAPAADIARPFDRPNEDPATVERRQPASNDDNERALREALMNLQRMGK